ncbi:MAG TPA: secretin N-terminal domain-containing protein, partial [Planctomycetota bacterium]|nr:secretin N-terminal domain-containing protein [Planctomycetota bacterium]
TEDNMKLIEDLVIRLDDKTASAVKLKLYSLRYADATAVAKLVNDLFGETPTNANQQNRSGNRGIPVWMAAQGVGAQQDQQGATKEVRAVPDLRTNSILVAASETRLVLIDAVMTEIDRQVNDLLEVKVYKLENADATQMAAILTSLFQPQIKATQSTGQTPTGNNQGRGGGPGVTMAGTTAGVTGQLLPSQEVEIAADVRTRSVVVKASKSYIQIVDAVVKQLDQDPTEAVSTFVYKFKNADAASLATPLQSLLRWPQGTMSGMQQNARPNQNQGPFSGMQQSSSLSGNSSGFGAGGGGPSGIGGARFGNLGPLEGPQDATPGPPLGPQEEGHRNVEGNVDLQADPTTNSLIVRTSPRNFMAMQNMFQELDRIRPQVLIKVLIADVTIDNSIQFGVEGFWENKMTPSNSTQSLNKFSTAFPLSTSGGTYSLTADNGKYQSTLNLFASEGKLKVLATPRILVLDNQTANINVGQSVPRITNTQISSISGTAINSVAYTNVGIILNVTPHIHPDGLVTMVVAPEISDVASQAESVPLGNGVSSPTFDLNSAQTTVAVRNGTTVVIGGMIHDSYDDTVQKVPVLGDIPLLGLLFSNTTRTVTKRELMIFLTPYVVFTEAELEEITQLEKAHMRYIDVRDIESESDRWLERVRK